MSLHHPELCFAILLDQGKLILLIFWVEFVQLVEFYCEKFHVGMSKNDKQNSEFLYRHECFSFLTSDENGSLSLNILQMPRYDKLSTDRIGVMVNND